MAAALLPLIWRFLSARATARAQPTSIVGAKKGREEDLPVRAIFTLRRCLILLFLKFKVVFLLFAAAPGRVRVRDPFPQSPPHHACALIRGGSRGAPLCRSGVSLIFSVDFFSSWCLLLSKCLRKTCLSM